MDYQFKGLPLTPSVCESLILEIFNGKTETRKTIVDTLMAEHKRRGGMDATASDIARVVKKALENLRKVEKAENPVQRYWKISNVSSTEPVPSLEEKKVKIDKDLPEPMSVKAEKDKPKIRLGEGNESVYLYYFPSFREKAENATEKRWSCKIGRSERDPVQRILSQGTTALPEKPVIAVDYRTGNSQSLEKAIHNILTYREQKIETSPGNEWFNTNIEEFLEIISFIEGH
jgi:hypothetical protein